MVRVPARPHRIGIGATPEECGRPGERPDFFGNRAAVAEPRRAPRAAPKKAAYRTAVPDLSGPGAAVPPPATTRGAALAPRLPPSRPKSSRWLIRHAPGLRMATILARSAARGGPACRFGSTGPPGRPNPKPHAPRRARSDLHPLPFPNSRDTTLTCPIMTHILWACMMSWPPCVRVRGVIVRGGISPGMRVDPKLRTSWIEGIEHSYSYSLDGPHARHHALCYPRIPQNRPARR
jgi:hypothetical protein